MRWAAAAAAAVWDDRLLLCDDEVPDDDEGDEDEDDDDDEDEEDEGGEYEGDEDEDEEDEDDEGGEYEGVDDEEDEDGGVTAGFTAGVVAAGGERRDRRRIGRRPAVCEARGSQGQRPDRHHDHRSRCARIATLSHPPYHAIPFRPRRPHGSAGEPRSIPRQPVSPTGSSALQGNVIQRSVRRQT